MADNCRRRCTQIEAQIGSRLRSELGAPAVQVHRLGEPFTRGRPVPFPHYVVSASSPGPLLVRVKYSSQQRFLLGYFQTDWYLWLPGLQFLLATTEAGVT